MSLPADRPGRRGRRRPEEVADSARDGGDPATGVAMGMFPVPPVAIPACLSFPSSSSIFSRACLRASSCTITRCVRMYAAFGCCATSARMNCSASRSTAARSVVRTSSATFVMSFLFRGGSWRASWVRGRPNPTKAANSVPAGVRRIVLTMTGPDPTRRSFLKASAALAGTRRACSRRTAEGRRAAARLRRHLQLPAPRRAADPGGPAARQRPRHPPLPGGPRHRGDDARRRPRDGHQPELPGGERRRHPPVLRQRDRPRGRGQGGHGQRLRRSTGPTGS